MRVQVCLRARPRIGWGDVYATRDGRVGRVLRVLFLRVIFWEAETTAPAETGPVASG